MACQVERESYRACDTRLTNKMSVTDAVVAMASTSVKYNTLLISICIRKASHDVTASRFKSEAASYRYIFLILHLNARLLRILPDNQSLLLIFIYLYQFTRVIVCTVRLVTEKPSVVMSHPPRVLQLRCVPLSCRSS